MDKSIFSSKINLLQDNIFEVASLPRGNYDGQALQYDKLISSVVYSRLMWGNSPEDYTAFCRKGVESHQEGVIADIGCGTLSFSAEVYAKSRLKNLYLCDLSYEMLSLGKKRLEAASEVGADVTFLRSDALAMPFIDESVQTLFCFGFLHLFNDPAALVKELRRLLKTGGRLYLTSLCTDRKFSARYMKLLHKKGHVSTPKHSSEVISIISENGFSKIESQVKGGMVYITASK